MRSFLNFLTLLVFTFSVIAVSESSPLFIQPSGEIDKIIVDNFSEGANLQGFILMIDSTVMSFPHTSSSFWPNATHGSGELILGGERDLQLTVQGSMGGKSFMGSAINSIPSSGSSFWEISTPSSAWGFTSIQWDGLDGGSPSLSGTGLGPMDFTDGGNNRHLHITFSCDVSTELWVTIASPEGQCSYSFTIKGDETTNVNLTATRNFSNNDLSVWIPFSDITGSCDLTQVGGLEIRIDQDKNIDATVFFVSISGVEQ